VRKLNGVTSITNKRFDIEQEDNTGQLQNFLLLKVYTFYRVILSLGLLLTFFLTPEEHLVGAANPDFFVLVTSIYLAVNIVGLIIVFPKKRPFNVQQLFANFFVDIIVIIFITDSSGGISSGMGTLLMVTIAASSIILRGQVALLTAAMASILIIADTVLLTSSNQLDPSSFLASGLLGIILFITSFFIQTLSQRILGAQQVAKQRAVDVSKLQKLNRQIIQSMRTGILVTNSKGYLQMANEAASELLGSNTLHDSSKPAESHILHPKLMEQLHQWQQLPQFHTPSFRATETGPELQASFSSLSDNSTGDILIFLEDNRVAGQRAQQMKLASLGRLTASIAHEIRNPLSAISHAAQLLNESEELDKADKRLSEIIYNHSKRMDKVIENVLQLSRRSAPNPENICLNEWLDKFVSEFSYEDGREFDIELLTHQQQYNITADSSQLNQVISNLVHNGLRYSLQNTNRATLTLDIHINPVTQLPVLDIIDNGVGIDEGGRKHLFEPFFTTELKGTGLGLYISRELCEANDARIDYIKTELNKSCFRISFPHQNRRLAPH
jgi:two-component system sensor histidine kinase PilS (NtrC family)